MNQLPKVSVIVPVYNLERYISRCLDSILAQSFTDFECICVNDGSIDTSASILDEYQKKDSRVKIIHKENGGLPSARKAGLERARGEFICHVDGDDYLEHNALAILIQEQSRIDADIVFADYYVDYESTGAREYVQDYVFTGYDAAALTKQLLSKGQFFIWCKLIRKSLYKNVELPAEIRYTEDMVHLVQLATQCRRSSCVNQPLYHYVKRTGSMTDALSVASHKQWHAATQYTAQHCKKQPFAHSIRPEILKLCVDQADVYLQHVHITGYFRNDLRTLTLSVLKNWAASGRYSLSQLPGSSKMRLFLCLISQRLAVLFGKIYNKIVHHV